MHKHVGPYQRPAPPKRPMVSAKPKPVQGPAVPLHEIEAMGRALIEDALLGPRKPGRPSIDEQPMTPAERQARRRKRQATERQIQETLRMGPAHGKSHEEAVSGGYDSRRIDAIYSARETEYLDGGDGEAHIGRKVCAKGASGISREPQDDCSDHHYVQRISIRGIQIGDEESNRRRFAEDELEKMVWAYFNSSSSSPAVSWISEHVGNSSVQSHSRASLTLKCKLCPDTMGSVEDAQDHLRADHEKTIREWFRKLRPRREFRDMKDYVTVVVPRRHISASLSKS